MKRRSYLEMVVGVVGAAGVVVGSGAFGGTQAAASRSTQVSVVTDNQAFLSLEGRSEFIEEQSGVLQIQIGELEFGEGMGVGAESEYHLAGTDGNGLFTLRNESPTDVDIFAEQSEPGKPKVELFNAHSGEAMTESTPQRVNSGGDPVPIGIKIDTTGIEDQEDPMQGYDRTLTIVAYSD